MDVVSDRLLSRWVLAVLLFPRYFIPHLYKIHVDARVTLDELFELLQNWCKLFCAMLVDMLDLSGKPLMLDTVVRWEPSTGPVVFVSPELE